MIHFLNTLTGKKEPFKPLTENKVKMYCCGVTPYSNTHVGHSRTFFSYDLLYRTLKDQGFDVVWARNITDVDDKIITKAREEGISCESLVARYVHEQEEMLSAFNLNKPQFEPKVTENIDRIIVIISTLIEKNFAYVSGSGVYFRVRKYKNYGKLSKNKIDELKNGARIEVDETKEDALDFALWKFAKPDEISWSSPWGSGRPGWHIECSAMIQHTLGDTIDIHMGGRDLIFPHHEAEIAQSESATGKNLSQVWMHAGMVTLYGEKMSKSTNHYVSIKDFLTKYPPEVLRLVFLSVSYSQQLDFTFELVEENFKKLCKIYRFYGLVDSFLIQNEKEKFTENVFDELENLTTKMRSALNDDLNSPQAVAVLFQFIRNCNTKISIMEKKGCTLNDTDFNILLKYWEKTKNWITDIFGILNKTPQQFFSDLSLFNLGSQISLADIDRQIYERKLARENKDWSKSDQIRDDLLAQGILIQDTPCGTKWTVQI